MMGMPDSSEMSERRARAMAEELENLGIKVIMAFHRIDPRLLRELNQREIYTMSQIAGQRRIHSWSFAWWSSEMPNWAEVLIDWVRHNEGFSGLAVSCRWGVDRTGSAVAFLHAVTCTEQPVDAWASVINSNREDVRNLDLIFQTRGLGLPSESEHIGTLRTGRSGARAHSGGYRAYVIRTLDLALDILDDGGLQGFCDQQENSLDQTLNPR
jgi:hypothetical protein